MLDSKNSNQNLGSRPATSMVRERYAPYRAISGKISHFETADFRPLTSPFDLQTIASVGFMNEAQAFENLETLKRTFDEMNIPPAHERVEILRRVSKRIEDKVEFFADLIAWEGGKPLKDARIEVMRAANTVMLAAEEAGRVHGAEIPMRATSSAQGHLAVTRPEPLGVVLAISAFNHPLNLIAHQVAPAVAAGCPILVKPASATPLSCLHFLDLLHECGLPPECALPLVADGEVAEKIAKSSKIRFMSFIGSAKVGWHLRSVVAPGTRLSLEHGGSAPAIVDESADLDAIIPTLVKGGYYHAGQVCVSTQRIYVHQSIAERFEEKFLNEVAKLKTGDPRDEDTDCGPIIRSRDLERIHARIEAAKEKGAKVLVGGEVKGETCYQPTVVRGVPKGDDLLKEEIFGPVVCLESFQDLEQAIEMANDVDWEFQAAIFTRDIDRAMFAARRLKSAAVMINASTAFRVDWMPFRGDGPSGYGTGGVPYAVRDLTREKLIVIKSQAFEEGRSVANKAP